MSPKKERKWSKEWVVGVEKRERVSIKGRQHTYSTVVDRVGCVTEKQRFQAILKMLLRIDFNRYMYEYILILI